MIGNSIHETALEALRTRTLIRLPHMGGDASNVCTKPALTPEPSHADSISRLVDSLWAKKGKGRFDGALMGVTSGSITKHAVTLTCRPIRYRDYLATDAVLEAHPDSPFPLAVGVHAILSCPKGIVCLRLESGRFALPGGAVDAGDLAGTAGQALDHAVGREVAEETGIRLRGHPLQITGLYIGGYPTHILTMFFVELSEPDIERTISTFHPDDALDQVRSIELQPLDDLMAKMVDLPLVMRAALRSLRHWRGEESAWVTAT